MLLLLDGPRDVLGGVGFAPEEIASAGLTENEVQGRRVGSDGNSEDQRERSGNAYARGSSNGWESIGVAGSAEGGIGDGDPDDGVLLDTRGSEEALVDGIVTGERGAVGLGKQDTAADVERGESENESAATGGAIGIQGMMAGSMA